MGKLGREDKFSDFCLGVGDQPRIPLRHILTHSMMTSLVLPPKNSSEGKKGDYIKKKTTLRDLLTPVIEKYDNLGHSIDSEI